MNQFRVGVGTFTTTPRMRALVNQVLDSNRLSYGPMSRELEGRFAAAHGCRYGVLSNSGTSSLQVALQALKELGGWQDGDEVIVPAVTFVATVNVVLHNRLRPVLVDVNPCTYNIDPFLVKEALSERTRAIIPVHLFGHPADVNLLRRHALEGRPDIKIIEDSCECMYATHHGQSVGSLGDIACFSTYVAHLMTTGVGGIATTNNPEYAAKMRSLVNHGRDGIYLDVDTESSREVIERRFHFESVGHSFRITELEAALGVAQLDEMPAIVRRRQSNARLLSAGLADLEAHLQLPTIQHHSSHSFMMYPLVLLGDVKADFTHYLEQRGIETRDMLPLTNQPVYQDMIDPDDYPVADWINKRGLYIGCHQDLTTADIDYAIEVIRGYFP